MEARPGPFAGVLEVLTYASGDGFATAETSGDAYKLAQKQSRSAVVIGVALGGQDELGLVEEEPEKRIQRQLKSETVWQMVCQPDTERPGLSAGAFEPRHLAISNTIPILAVL